MTATDTRRTDLYPSRVSGSPELLERRDPVVYGGPDDGPLTADQLATFDRDGVLQLEGLFAPDEVARFRTRLDELRRDPGVLARDRTITEPDDDEEVRSIFEIHPTDDLFAEVAADPRVAGVARQLLGSDVYIHQSRINFKPGFHGAGFWWHSDFETWHTEDGMPRPRAVSAAISLTDNHPFNGPLLVIGGSHRTYVTTVGETPEDHYRSSLRRQEVGVPDVDSLAKLAADGPILQITGGAGSVAFFDCNAMHGSADNITPYPRSNVFLVYNSVENALEDPFAAASPRPSFIASREVVPLPR